MCDTAYIVYKWSPSLDIHMLIYLNIKYSAFCDISFEPWNTNFCKEYKRFGPAKAAHFFSQRKTRHWPG